LSDDDARVTVSSQNYCGAAATVSSWKLAFISSHLVVPGRRSVAMVRELQLLTVGFVFVFLGAIVVGVF